MQKLDAKVYGHLYREADGMKIPPDEYVVFRPHDKAFLRTLRFYRDECVRQGCLLEQIEAVDALLARVAQWQRDHPERMKVADVEPGELNLEVRTNESH